MSTDEMIEDLVDLYSAERASRGVPRAHIHRIAERRRRSVGPGIPKATAARALGVSVPTLDKWIARGRVRTVRNLRTNRQQVDAQQLVPLVAEVRALRRLGRKEGILLHAIEALQQQDAGYRGEVEELYGESLQAAENGDPQIVTLPGNFGPDD